MNIIVKICIASMLSINFVVADERTKIETLINIYGEAMSESNSEKVMKLYASNAVFIPNGSPTAINQLAVKQAYEHEFNSIDLEVKAVVDEIIIGETIATARTRSQGKVTVLASGVERNTESYLCLVCV